MTRELSDLRKRLDEAVKAPEVAKPVLANPTQKREIARKIVRSLKASERDPHLWRVTYQPNFQDIFSGWRADYPKGTWGLEMSRPEAFSDGENWHKRELMAFIVFGHPDGTFTVERADWNSSDTKKFKNLDELLKFIALPSE